MKIMGVDVARYGDEATIITISRGPDVQMLRTIMQGDIQWTVDRIKHDIIAHAVDVLFVCGSGTGASLVDALRSKGVLVVETINGRAAALAVLEKAQEENS